MSLIYYDARHRISIKDYKATEETSPIQKA